VARITGHRFADLHLLEQGLSHASTCSHIEDPKERLAGHNERLEFLGDAMLGAAVAYMLYERFPEADEGFMSRCKGQLVSRKTLAKAMHQHGLLRYAHLGNQMDQDAPTSVLANLAEGLLGAIYLDGGWLPLRHAVSALLDAQFTETADKPPSDAKNSLQMWGLEHHRLLPVYQSERCGGSDHEPRFHSTVRVGEHHASAQGSSRRNAEANAATELLKRLALHGEQSA
jgi:ribonuclease-3